MAKYGGESTVAVAVAVSGNRSEIAVRWASQNLFPDAHRVFLLHVIPSISVVPDPSGRTVPIGEAKSEVAEMYVNERKMQAMSGILPLKKLCRTKNEVEIIVFDGDCAADILLKYVSESGVDNLVLGGSSWTWLKRMLKGPDIPTAVMKAAPNSVSVFVVSRHSLIVKMANSNINSGSRAITKQKTFGGRGKNDKRMSLSSSFSAELRDVAAMRFLPSSEVNGDANRKVSDNLNASTTDGEIHLSSSPSSRGNRKRRYSSNVFLESRTLDKQEFLGSFRDKPVILWTSKSQRSQSEEANEVESLKHELQNALAMYNQARKDLALAQQQVQALSAERSEALRREETMKRIAAEEKIKHLLAVKQTRKLLDKETFSSPNKPEQKDTNETEAAFFGLNTNLRRYTLREIESGTDNFSPARKIGEGGFGHVYRGVLDHIPVAIKALREDGLGRLDEFVKEVEVLSKLRHPHLLLLLGACPEKGCLVYEYMENCSLEDKLFRRRQRDKAPLPWFVRVRVLLEVACGLAFLHGSKPEPIVHRDLKPGNILLDRNLVSKIGDVGLAKLLPRVAPDGVTEYKDTVLAGTLHYIDPEYQRTGTLRPRSDLYAFGVVTLQVLTGAPPVGLTTIVETAVVEGRLRDVLDVSVSDWPLAEAEQLAKLGIQCCRLRCRDRPDLESEIIPELARLAESADSFARLRGPSLGPAPAQFFCPILKVLMENPYLAADGFSYERRAIRAWMEKQRISPVTGFELQHTSLTPNHALRSAILEWKSALTTPHNQIYGR